MIDAQTELFWQTGSSNAYRYHDAIVNSLLPPISVPQSFGGFEWGFSKTATKGKKLSTRGSQQRLIGTSGDDRIESFRGTGKNLLKGNSGNDKLFAGSRDRLLGDAGNDLLDARKGKGNNLLAGGSGRDTLYAKTQDKLDGGQDTDILWAGLGGNQLKGGQGADQFWIANGKLPARVNFIKDFDLATDRIGVNNLPGVSRWTDLTIAQQGGDTLISHQGKAIALLSGITASSLTSQHFIGLQPGLATLSIRNVRVGERNVGTTSAILEVLLSSASTVPVTVDYRTVAGTATPNDNDYTSLSGTLTFVPGETSQVIAIDIIGDTKDEANETFDVILSNSSNATLSNAQAQVTILDDEPTLFAANGIQSEGSKTDSIDVIYNFDLYDITPVGNYRRDEDNNPGNTIGIFSGAIENFSARIREDGQFFDKFNRLSVGQESFNDPDIFIPEKLSLNLTAIFIPQGSTLTLPNGTTQVAGLDRIEYRLTNDRLKNEAGIFEWTLILENALFEESVFDFTKAVNSIEYIIANQLLGKADRMRLSITSAQNPQQLYVEEDIIEKDSSNSENNTSSAPRIIPLLDPPSIPRPVPYNNAIAPTNDTIPYARETGLSSNGLRKWEISSRIGTNLASSTKDVDLYKIQLNAGSTVLINTNNSSMDTAVRLFNANGNPLAAGSDFKSGIQFETEKSYLAFQATVSGVYYIGVSTSTNSAYNPLIANSGSAATGSSYNLNIEIHEANNTIARAFKTGLGTEVGYYTITTQIGDSASVLPGLDIDFYEVQLAAGEKLSIDTDTYYFAVNADRLDDSYVRLFNASGTQLAESDDAAAPFETFFTGFRDSYLQYTAPVAGTYYVGVSGFNNYSYDPLTGTGGVAGSTGFYTLELSRGF